jgi:class 3 adenylate cyclase
MDPDAFDDTMQEAAQAAVEALARAGLSVEEDAGADLLDAIHEALEEILREHGLEPDNEGDEED